MLVMTDVIVRFKMMKSKHILTVILDYSTFRIYISLLLVKCIFATKILVQMYEVNHSQFSCQVTECTIGMITASWGCKAEMINHMFCLFGTSCVPTELRQTFRRPCNSNFAPLLHFILTYDR